MDEGTLNLARKYMRRKRIVFDMCDNHFGTNHAYKHSEMIDLADAVTCPTEQMRDLIAEDGQGDHGNVTVIPDPHEFEFDEPFYSPKLELLWYGNNTNIQALFNIVTPYFILEQSTTINIAGESYRFCAVGDQEKNFWMRSYSKNTMLQELMNCDAVIIPQDNDWWGRVKSPNRLLEAVARGRFVLANSIPSYDVFKDWMWIGDIAEGLAWLKQQSGEEICNRIKKAQDHIKLNHSIETVTDQWEDVLTSVVGTAPGKVI